MEGRESIQFAEANALEDMLSEIPMGALNYHYPVEVAAAAFSLEQAAICRRARGALAFDGDREK